jgi:hypothetical protein
MGERRRVQSHHVCACDFVSQRLPPYISGEPYQVEHQIQWPKHQQHYPEGHAPQ